MNALAMILFVLLGVAVSARDYVPQRADLYLQCDQEVTEVLYTHYNNGTTLNWEYQGIEWSEEIHIVVADVCVEDMVTVFCTMSEEDYDAGNNGGFIATMIYNGQTYSTQSESAADGPWSYSADFQETTKMPDLQAPRGGGRWGAGVGNNIASNAQWIWRNDAVAIYAVFDLGAVSNNLLEKCRGNRARKDEDVDPDEEEEENEEEEEDEEAETVRVIALDKWQMSALFFAISLILAVSVANMVLCLQARGKSFRKVIASDNENY